MMLANAIQKIFKDNAEYLDIDPDYIFSYSIDPNVNSDDDGKILILITEIDNTPLNYGSNHSIDRKASVQVQIFFPNSYEGDTSGLRDKVRDVLEKYQWYCSLDTAITQDPDVDLLINTTHWEKSYKRM